MLLDHGETQSGTLRRQVRGPMVHLTSDLVSRSYAILRSA
jgi:hypothetical protein